MGKPIAAAFVIASILFPTIAFAQGGLGSTGDALAQTPPIDVKGKQIRAAGGVSRKNLRALHGDGSTARRVTPRS